MIQQKLKTFARNVITPRKYMQSTFAPFYTENCWGDPESASGPGSSLERTIKLRNELPILLDEIDVRTLLDAPCGDFNWMKHTILNVDQYIGVDIIPEIIGKNQSLYANERTRFVFLDLTRDELPCVDVILCRDCFIHFSNRHIVAAIKNFKRSRSRYLLTNTYPAWDRNKNIQTGNFRYLNLLLPPFNFPPPLRQIDEKFPEEQAEYFGKTLALWNLADL